MRERYMNYREIIITSHFIDSRLIEVVLSRLVSDLISQNHDICKIKRDLKKYVNDVTTFHFTMAIYKFISHKVTSATSHLPLNAELTQFSSPVYVTVHS